MSDQLPPPDDDPMLDNLLWHALGGPQSHLGETSSNAAAARYFPDISPFCAVRSVDQAGWDGLAELVGPGGVVVLFRDEVPVVPSDWQELMREQTTQFVAGTLRPAPDLGFVELGEADSDEMVALAKLTEPGPFGPRTYQTGRYIGLRRNGALVAMAGQRMRAGRWIEVSGVCVHPTAQREGLGGALTLAVAELIRAEGAEAMLHVREGNDPALALYEKLGFVVRRPITAGAFRYNP